MQDLCRRVERGGALSLDGVAAAAQPFVAALLGRLFPNRPLVVVTEALRAQEQFQQDLETWLNNNAERGTRNAERKTGHEVARSEFRTPHSALRTHFFPDWEILPHEDKLPHLDVISDRLKTLMALTEMRGAIFLPPSDPADSKRQTAGARNVTPPIITNVVALTQRTFAPADLSRRLHADRNRIGFE